jgi:hypothetical protein
LIFATNAGCKPDYHLAVAAAAITIYLLQGDDKGLPTSFPPSGGDTSDPKSGGKGLAKHELGRMSTASSILRTVRTFSESLSRLAPSRAGRPPPSTAHEDGYDRYDWHDFHVHVG